MNVFSDCPSRGEVVWIRCLRSFEGAASRADFAVSLLSRAVAAAALVLTAATWPLWSPSAAFPRVPFLGPLRGTPARLEEAWLGIGCVALVTWLVAGRERRIGRWSMLVFVGAAACLVLADQHRLQPWAYEFSVLALILAVLPPREAIGWARLLVASIYFYSALSKLDWTFVESGGGQIVDGLLTFLHIGREHLGSSQQIVAGSLAVGEFLVGLGLCWRRWRRTALIGSIIMHGLLLAALGPWGAGHKPGVLLWNVFFIVQNVILFGVAGESSQPVENGFDRLGKLEIRSKAGRLSRFAVRGLVAFVVLFPLTEPFGVCDIWPAWAVYATGPERLRVYVDATDRSPLPPDVQKYVEGPRFQDGRYLVRIDRWSLDATRAPVYPQNRFRLGVALALAQAAGLDESIRVEIDGQANRWSGRRSSRTVTGAAAISAELDRDWLNGDPRPFADGPGHSKP
jgi:hypothetical protein